MESGTCPKEGCPGGNVTMDAPIYSGDEMEQEGTCDVCGTTFTDCWSYDNTKTIKEGHDEETDET